MKAVLAAPHSKFMCSLHPQSCRRAFFVEWALRNISKGETLLMDKTRKKREGFVLPAVIIFIIFTIMMGLTLLEIGTLELIDANRRTDREKAFYLAEAGIGKAMAAIRVDPDHSFLYAHDENNPYSLGGGEIVLEYDSDNNTLISTGRVGARNSPEEESIKVYLSSEGTGGPGVFTNGIFGRGSISVKGSSKIRGYDSRDGSEQDAFAGSVEHINLTGNPSIFGDAAVSEGGTIDYPLWKPLAITGDKIYDLPEPVLPPVEIPPSFATMPYLQEADPGFTPGSNYQVDGDDNFSIGQWPFVAGITSGDYRVNDFEMTSNAELTVDGDVRFLVEGDIKMPANAEIILEEAAALEIYFDGDLAVRGSSRINPGGRPANVALYSTSDRDLELTGNVQVYAAIYAPESHFFLAGSSPLYGALIAQTAELVGNVTVYHDVALNEMVVPGDPGGSGSGEVLIEKWTKPGWTERF